MPALDMHALLLTQLCGRNSSKLSIRGSSLEAGVTDASVWQLGFLPNAVASVDDRSGSIATTQFTARRHKVASSGVSPTGSDEVMKRP
ncbi:hypothetical protein AYR46_22175 [Sphingobium yanoikuyae]|nr:hypothetical protein AYR46_22175 [Sphingobium yanoikuyae]